MGRLHQRGWAARRRKRSGAGPGPCSGACGRPCSGEAGLCHPAVGRCLFLGGGISSTLTCGDGLKIHFPPVELNSGASARPIFMINVDILFIMEFLALILFFKNNCIKMLLVWEKREPHVNLIQGRPTWWPCKLKDLKYPQKIWN